MIPIPKRLLTSSATVRTPKERSMYGGEYNDPVTIGRVCFQGEAGLRKTAYQLQSPIKGVLIIDPRASANAFEIPAGSLVRIDGEDAESVVKECMPVPSAENLHHWEVTLA